MKLHTGGNVNTSCLECYTRLFLNFVPSCLSLQAVFEKGARHTCRHYFTPYTNASFLLNNSIINFSIIIITSSNIFTRL